MDITNTEPKMSTVVADMRLINAQTVRAVKELIATYEYELSSAQEDEKRSSAESQRLRGSGASEDSIQRILTELQHDTASVRRLERLIAEAHEKLKELKKRDNLLKKILILIITSLSFVAMLGLYFYVSGKTNPVSEKSLITSPDLISDVPDLGVSQDLTSEQNPLTSVPDLLTLIPNLSAKEKKDVKPLPAHLPITEYFYYHEEGKMRYCLRKTKSDCWVCPKVVYHPVLHKKHVYYSIENPERRGKTLCEHIN